MRKEYFDSLRPAEQADEMTVVENSLNEMVKEQFNFAKMAAFIELAKERIGALDVVPRMLVEGRHVGGSTGVNPPVGG